MFLALFLVFLVHTSSARQVEWDGNGEEVIVTGNDDELQLYGDPRVPDFALIFPGTKWCGAGNIAENNDDLGEHRETDKCCRAHDFCDDSIDGHDTKYNLTNPVFYTRLACKCDEEFWACLHKSGSKPSIQVGVIYFNFLGTKCYRKDYPVVKCVEHVYVPIKKCVEYKYDTSKEMVYQWFDVPAF